MPGFGEGPFGSGAFGEWPWSLATIVEGIPDIYQEQDALGGAGTLAALLEGLVPSLDDLRQKVRDYDVLRDPLKAPIDTSFDETVLVIRTDNQGDGTSIVFISQGVNDDKFTGVRPGMTLIDLIGNRFTILSVHSSSLPTDVTNPPIDPATGQETGRYIVVENIGQASTELIPFTSSTLTTNENPDVVNAVGSIVAVPKASIIDGETFTLNDGAHPSVVFEFDVTPDGVVPGHIPVNISLATSALDVANLMVDAINLAPNLNLQASNAFGASTTVTIKNLTAGTAGNGAIWSETVADAGFILTQPSGGAAGAFPLDPAGIDNGVAGPPYVFNTYQSYVNGLPIAPNRVTITWVESGIAKEGFFTAEGLPGGDLADAATINPLATVGALAAGQIKLYNDSGAVIDADTIEVTYTSTPLVQTEDSEIRAQNILAFLASDYGIKLDRNDPEFLQRSYVNSAFKIWDIKGTELGYYVLGKYAGYFVQAFALYAISNDVAAGLPVDFVFAFPAGTQAVGSIQTIPASSIADGETFTLDDGVNPPTIFEFDTNGSVLPGNVAVNILAAITAIDVATAMVSAINGVGGSLNLSAGNVIGSSSVVTITNGQIGVIGNVTDWSDTVVDPGFAITQPTGGIDSDWFTTINPGREQFDEVALDAIPLDELCSDTLYPSTVQTVNVTGVEFVEQEGSNVRNKVTVTTTVMYQSYNTDGTFTDSSSGVFDVQNFERVNNTTYTFEVSSITTPALGAGTVEWKVLQFTAPNTVTITGLGTDVEDLGIQYRGYTGHRYRITKTFIDPILSDVGNWAFIDSNGVISYIENFELITGTTYEFEIISATVPATGPANIFYYCEIVTACDFCRASSILVRISPGTILNFPEALEGDALSRLIIRLQQMVPGHIRIAAFLYDPGPAVATWSIAASSQINTSDLYDDPYTAMYDFLEYPADSIPTDSAAIIATSDVTIVDLNVLEEYLIGPEDPLTLGTWTATGQWHITQYRSFSATKSFNYGHGDVGVMGQVGAVAPIYDNGGVSTGTLTSPSVSVAAASFVTLRFSFYGNMRSGVVNDVVKVNVVKDAGSVVLQTITKFDMGLTATGTNTGYQFGTSIGPSVIGVGSFHIEFIFDSVGSTAGQTGEGWYIDNIEIKVNP